MEFLKEINPRVLIETNHGDMEVELFPDNAPLTVENYLKLVNNSFYENLIFHRVISGFMIQGGDPTGSGMGGSEENVKGEFSSNKVENPTKHLKGVISMARSMMPNSASSQFFICHDDIPHLDRDYAGFGIVVKGIEVVDSIASVNTNGEDKPLEEVVIKKITQIK